MWLESAQKRLYERHPNVFWIVWFLAGGGLMNGVLRIWVNWEYRSLVIHSLSIAMAAMVICYRTVRARRDAAAGIHPDGKWPPPSWRGYES